MARRHISQNEAHALAKSVEAMNRERENQRASWSRAYPGGTHLGYIKRERDWFHGILESANRLNHAIVVIPDSAGKIDFYALPLPK